VCVLLWHVASYPKQGGSRGAHP